MRRLVPAIVLASLAALPARAQTAESACTNHRGDEVRCATNFPRQGGGNFNVALRLVAPGGAATITADTWQSRCGLPGDRRGTTQVANSGNPSVAAISVGPGPEDQRFAPPENICVEVFLRNCMRDGRPVSCQQVIGVGASVVMVSRR